MRSRYFSALLTLAATVLFISSANASILQGTGSFSAPYSSGPVANLSSTFAFSFDQSVVLPVGSQSFHNIPTTLFTLSPNPLGATTFSTANAGVSLFYSGTTLTDLVVGGLVDGTSTISGAAPYSDFYFLYNVSSGTLTNTVYHLPPNGALGNGGGGQASVLLTVVPEPMSAAIVGAMSIAAIRRRR